MLLTSVCISNRWNDLIIHSAIAQLFFEKQRVHHFRGWSYAHNSRGFDSKLRYGLTLCAGTCTCTSTCHHGCK